MEKSNIAQQISIKGNSKILIKSVMTPPNNGIIKVKESTSSASTLKKETVKMIVLQKEKAEQLSSTSSSASWSFIERNHMDAQFPKIVKTSQKKKDGQLNEIEIGPPISVLSNLSEASTPRTMKVYKKVPSLTQSLMVFYQFPGYCFSKSD